MTSFATAASNDDYDDDGDDAIGNSYYTEKHRLTRCLLALSHTSLLTTGDIRTAPGPDPAELQLKKDTLLVTVN